MPLLYLLFVGFIWLFQLGMMSLSAFSLPLINNINDLFMLILNLLAFVLPIFSSIAILYLRRIGIYALVLSFLSSLYLQFSQLSVTIYNMMHGVLDITSTLLFYFLPFIVFWILYFVAIRRKWHLFT